MTSGMNLTPFGCAELGALCTQEGEVVRRQKPLVSRDSLSRCATLNMRHSTNLKAWFVTPSD
jgi:hypothetical protein